MNTAVTEGLVLCLPTMLHLLVGTECTDARFLPERFKKLSLAEVNERIALLKATLGE